MKKPQTAKLFAILLLTTGLTIGCGAQQEKKPTMSPEAASAINSAKAENKKAAAVGYEWRDTGKLLKKAEAAAKKGQNDEAIKLANKAKTQASLAIKQHQLEQGIDRSLK
jgi:hypothetical protein